MALPDLNELALFARVAEQRSLTAAARTLGLPKSTLSRKLTQLEARLGVRLLHRTPRQLRLTEAGASLYARCGGPLSQLTEAVSELSQREDSLRGRIRVSAPGDFGVSVCAPLVQEFLGLHPEVDVELLLTDRYVDLVAEGFDVAIRVGEAREASLVARLLGSVEAFFVASPDYLARHGTPRRPQELTRHACVIFSSQSAGNVWGLSGARGALATVEVRGPLTVNSLVVARDAALAGLGIARLPEYICADDLRVGRLSRILSEWSSGGRKVFVVYPGRRVAARVRLFLDFLQERAAAFRLG